MVGSSGKQLVSLKQGLGFETLCMQNALLGDSPTTARCATRVDQRISRGEAPDTVAGNQKKKKNKNK